MLDVRPCKALGRCLQEIAKLEAAESQQGNRYQLAEGDAALAPELYFLSVETVRLKAEGMETSQAAFELPPQRFWTTLTHLNCSVLHVFLHLFPFIGSRLARRSGTPCCPAAPTAASCASRRRPAACCWPRRCPTWPPRAPRRPRRALWP